jgi:hypothetical protein
MNPAFEFAVACYSQYGMAKIACMAKITTYNITTLTTGDGQLAVLRGRVPCGEGVYRITGTCTLSNSEAAHADGDGSLL